MASVCRLIFCYVFYEEDINLLFIQSEVTTEPSASVGVNWHNFADLKVRGSALIFFKTCFCLTRENWEIGISGDFLHSFINTLHLYLGTGQLKSPVRRACSDWLCHMRSRLEAGRARLMLWNMRPSKQNVNLQEKEWLAWCHVSTYIKWSGMDTYG